MNRSVLQRMSLQRSWFSADKSPFGMTLSIGNDHSIDRFELCSYHLIRVEQ